MPFNKVCDFWMSMIMKRALEDKSKYSYESFVINIRSLKLLLCDV